MNLKTSFILIITIFFPFLILVKQPGFNPLSFSENAIFIILLFFYLISLKVKLGGKFIFLTSLSLFLIIYLIFLIPVNPKLSLLLSYLTHFKYLLVIFPIIKIFNKRDEIKLIKLLILVGVLSQLPALYTIISNPLSLLSLFGTGGYSRTESVFPNSNMYGAYLTVISLLNIFLIDYFNKNKQKLLLLFFIQLPTFILLILTFSRRSWGLFLLSTLIYILFKKGKKNKKFAIPISFFLVFVASKIDLTAISSRFLTIFSSDYQSNSIRQDQLNELSTFIFKDFSSFIMGNGPGLIGPVSKLSMNPQLTQIDNYLLFALVFFYKFLL